MNDGSISARLYQFFAAYFHQDWDLEADDWEGIVDGYVADHPAAQQLQTLAQEVDDLREARREPELEEFLVNIVGVYYVPESHTYRVWLGEIAQQLRQRAVGISNAS